MTRCVEQGDPEVRRTAGSDVIGSGTPTASLSRERVRRGTCATADTLRGGGAAKARGDATACAPSKVRRTFAPRRRERQAGCLGATRSPPQGCGARGEALSVGGVPRGVAIVGARVETRGEAEPTRRTATNANAAGVCAQTRRGVRTIWGTRGERVVSGGGTSSEEAAP